MHALRGFQRACLAAGAYGEGADAQLRETTSYAKFVAACRERKLTAALPRFHDLRHAYATHALAAGLSAHVVARLLGHSDAGLVWARYGHALPDELAGAADALSGWRQARAATHDL